MQYPASKIQIFSTLKFSEYIVLVAGTVITTQKVAATAPVTNVVKGILSIHLRRVKNENKSFD